MEVPVSTAQIGAMKHPILVAGILTAVAATTQARDSKPPDVTVYVNGHNRPASSVDQPARAIVSWIFARVGILIAWGEGGDPPSDMQQQMRTQFGMREDFEKALLDAVKLHG